jgi:hypothetical protein
MIVNDGTPIIGSVSGRFQGLDLLTPLYLGSVPNMTALSKTVGIKKGFVGCISQVRELTFISLTSNKLLFKATVTYF